MPIQSEPLAASEIQVAPSAAVELMWVLHSLTASHPLKGAFSTLEPLRAELGPSTDAFWADGVRGFTEEVVLAERCGALFDTDLNRFFARLAAACELKAGAPSLLSESPLEREALRARLERLRTEPALRSSYVSLLQSVWKAVEPEWRSVGLPAVTEAAADWRRRLEAGSAFSELLDRPQIWPGRPDIDVLAQGAATQSRLVLSPSWFGGDIHVVELDGMLLAGRGVRRRDDDQQRRDAAVQVSSRLKTLADPTRLAILLQLAREPASVTEVARRLKLSQPTVSGHVQLLREAGLLEERSVGRSARLTASEEQLHNLLSGAEDALIKLFRR
ncbi:MAG: ArsR/SmtB family transcription factor [Candidatus Dormibacteraceae bacterium]